MLPDRAGLWCLFRREVTSLNSIRDFEVRVGIPGEIASGAGRS